eukprot:362997-Chlamydomonas_euryale.AAC.8
MIWFLVPLLPPCQDLYKPAGHTNGVTKLHLSSRAWKQQTDHRLTLNFDALRPLPPFLSLDFRPHRLDLVNGHDPADADEVDDGEAVPCGDAEEAYEVDGVAAGGLADLRERRLHHAPHVEQDGRERCARPEVPEDLVRPADEWDGREAARDEHEHDEDDGWRRGRVEYPALGDVPAGVGVRVWACTPRKGWASGWTCRGSSAEGCSRGCGRAGMGMHAFRGAGIRAWGCTCQQLSGINPMRADRSCPSARESKRECS